MQAAGRLATYLAWLTISLPLYNSKSFVDGLSTNHPHGSHDAGRAVCFPVGRPSKAWASLATDLTNLEYVLNLPLTAYIWTHFMRIRPLVFIVPRAGSLSAKERFVLEWTRRAGAVVEVVLPRSGDMVSTVSQNVRLTAWALPYVDGGDYIITADIDIWPISCSYWKDMLDLDRDITIVNGEFFMRDEHSPDRVAISYVGMQSHTWAGIVANASGMAHNVKARHVRHGFRQSQVSARRRDFEQRIPAVDDVVAAILDLGRQTLGEGAWDAAPGAGGTKSHVQWSWDQQFLTRAILRANKTSPMDIKFGKHLMSRRLDRAAWNFAGDAEAHSDAHLVSPLTDAGVWDRLRQVWVSMFGDASWADQYYAGVQEMFL